MGRDVEGGNVEKREKLVEAKRGMEPITVRLWEEGWESRAKEAWEVMWGKNRQYVQIWGGWTSNSKTYTSWGRALEVLRVERGKLREHGERGKAFAIFS